MRQIKKFFHRYGEMVPTVGSLVLTVGLVWFGIIPVGRTTWTLYGHYQKETEEIDILQKKSSILQSLDDGVLRQNLDELGAAVPFEKSPGSIFATVEDVANTTGISVRSITMLSPGSISTESAKRQSKEEKTLDAYLLPVSVAVEGSYEELRQFIRESTGIRRLLRVLSFRLSFSPTGANRVLLSMDAAWAPLPAKIGGVAAEVLPLSEQEDALIRAISALPRGATPVSPVQNSDSDRTIQTPTNRNPFSLQ